MVPYLLFTNIPQKKRIKTADLMLKRKNKLLNFQN